MDNIKNINLISGLIDEIKKITATLTVVSELGEYENIVITDTDGKKKGVKLTKLGSKLVKDSIKDALKSEIDIKNSDLKIELYGESNIITTIKKSHIAYLANNGPRFTTWLINPNTFLDKDGKFLHDSLKTLLLLNNDSKIMLVIDNRQGVNSSMDNLLHENGLDIEFYTDHEYDISVDVRSGFNPKTDWDNILNLMNK